MDNNPERMKELIAKFILKNNYWGYLFSRIRRAPMDDLPSIAGVAPQPDGTIVLYYNPALTSITDDDSILHVIEHEGMHLLNKHIPRLLRILSYEISLEKKMIKSRVWNVAADCCVNTQANLPRKIKMGDNEVALCFPDLYELPDGKAAEFYYRRLLKKAEDQKKKQNQGEGKGQGEDESGKGQGSDLLQGDGSGNIDDHSKWSEAVKDVADLSSLSRKIDNYVGDIVRESVKNFNKQRGQLPGSVQELIDSLLQPPKAPYFQIIRKLVRASRLSKFQRAFTKINRKRTYVFSIDKENTGLPVISPFPGRTRDFTFDISLIIDTSGSMSHEEMKEALSGIKTIIENDRFCKVTVFECDTDIRKEYEVKKIKDIQFNMMGRGGTTLGPALEKCRKMESDVTLVFTDGECENINAISRRLLPKKIIWVLSGRGYTEQVNRTGYIVNIS